MNKNSNKIWSYKSLNIIGGLIGSLVNPIFLVFIFWANFRRMQKPTLALSTLLLGGIGALAYQTYLLYSLNHNLRPLFGSYVITNFIISIILIYWFNKNYLQIYQKEHPDLIGFDWKIFLWGLLGIVIGGIYSAIIYSHL